MTPAEIAAAMLAGESHDSVDQIEQADAVLIELIRQYDGQDGWFGRISLMLRHRLEHTYEMVVQNKQDGKKIREWKEPRPNVNSVDSAFEHALAKGLPLRVAAPEQDEAPLFCAWIAPGHGSSFHDIPARAAWMAVVAAL